ncbi:hypothetical protein SPJ1_1385 [Streptococcus parauberis KRS-02083]|uniref:Uncharacterized protein n=1 Tax=Streptococcus parauberis KRS-02083 TaxID=1207545 RepID=A0ABN0IQY4_9STRE|nr:hypothetical protein SPJ1_1385 [Streptococcus parauberis KRS-02083]
MIMQNKRGVILFFVFLTCAIIGLKIMLYHDKLLESNY